MKLKLTKHQPVDRDEDVYTLTVSHGALRRVRFTEFDRMLLRDCQSDGATVADKLLALELIARRVEEESVGAPLT